MAERTAVTSDQDLLARIAKGDRVAFQSLYARHNVRLFRFLLRRTGNKAAAEDLVHDVFLDVWKSAARFEGRSQVTTWLLAMAHNKSVDSLRRRGAEPLDENAMNALEDFDPTPEQQSASKSEGELIRQCMTRLTPEHREIIDLVYYQEQSVAEIAVILGIPESTVKTRMFYARKHLKTLLAEAGVER
jgi:RNA polymerase sigma-70 factor (ECF subfamily)